MRKTLLSLAFLLMLALVLPLSVYAQDSAQPNDIGESATITAEPVAVEAAPMQPAPVEPAPVEPAPVESAPVESAPVEPAPAESAAVKPTPIESAPPAKPVPAAEPASDATGTSVPVPTAPPIPTEVQKASVAEALAPQVESVSVIAGEERYINGVGWGFYSATDNQFITGFQRLADGRTVYYGADKGMVFGKATIGGMPYTFGNDGNLLNETGEAFIDGLGWTYFDRNTAEYQKGFFKLEDGRHVYYNDNYTLRTEALIFNDLPYEFSSEDGRLKNYGEQFVNGRGWAYLSPLTGGYIAGVAALPDGRTVIYNNSGFMQFGDVVWNQTRYRTDAGSGSLHTGEIFYKGGGWTYLDPTTLTYTVGIRQLPDGRTVLYNHGNYMVLGEDMVFGLPYRTNVNDGSIITGESYFDGRGWMYLDPTSHTYLHGFHTLPDLRDVYYGDDLSMEFGWFTIGDSKYFALDHGQLLKGWQKFDDGVRYFDTTTARMATGWVHDSGYWLLLRDHDGLYLDSTNTDPRQADAVFQIINTERGVWGRDALEIDYDLMALATLRAREIFELFSHTRPNGSAWNSVLAEHDGEDQYWYVNGENIARGYTSPSEVMNAWMNSEGHRENILDIDYTHVGIGVFKDPTTGTMFWVQFFGEGNWL